MKVAMVTWTFPEHFEPYTIDHAVGLVNRGIDCEVITVKVVADAPVPRQLQGRIAIRPAGSRVRTRGRRRCALLDTSADVIHFQHVGLALQYQSLLSQIQAPKVVSCRGSDVLVEAIDSPWVTERLGYVLPRVDRIHCVSQDLADRCVSFGARPDQLFISRTGANLNVFARQAPGIRPEGVGMRLISVARLHWVKGFEYAVQAVRLLRESGQRVTYTIIGPDYGAAAEIRLAIRDYGLEDVVKMTGHLPPQGVRDMLAGADVFLQPSVSEGTPIAVMEAMAMAMALPVVATDVGGAREIVEDGVHGHVVPSRDPSAIAVAIEKLLPGAVRRRMGDAAAEHARRNFDHDTEVDRLVGVFESLMSREASRRVLPIRPGGDLLSVVVVARNAGATIDDQLRALSFQRYEGSWEVVIVDNGSTDDTFSRALAWQDRLPGLRVVDASSAETIGQARNVGVRAARGAHLVMCDPDDVVAPRWLSAFAQALQNAPLVFGAMERSMLAPRGIGREVDNAPVLDVRDQMRALTRNCGFQRGVFDRLGGFGTEHCDREDLDSGWRAALAEHEPCFVAEAVVHYRPRRQLSVAHPARRALGFVRQRVASL
ncbi:MAG: glycosyltransferase [Rhizomicrobium sp.]